MRKSALDIKWPKSFFTIEDIQNEHPTAKNITIRFRINKAIEDSVISCIGKNPTKVGRPTIVFASAPIDDQVLQRASDAGVVLNEAFESKIVKITKVTSSTVETPTEKVATPTPMRESVSR